MPGSLRRCFLCLSLLLPGTLPAFAAPNWTQPTPEELKMTADPAAPDAPATYLFREEIVDDKLHFHRVYARVKILTEKGKDEFSDIEIPYDRSVAQIRGVEGRTIHADGTEVPFTGKPYDKELVKRGHLKIMQKVFSMPDVQVGSILEYRYELQYDDRYVEPPRWFIQQDVYIHKAHYHFIPFDMSGSRFITVRDSLGKERTATRLLWYEHLPGTAKVQERIDGYDLVANDVPALTDEDYSPPMDSYSYRVLFYYSPQFSGKDFWKDEGKTWSKDVDRFANPSDKIRTAVAGIVAPNDTEQQKLQKIYAAVMGIENTRFTREHSAAENKAEGLRVKTAADIWEQKRGTDDEITRLFISMARAAGFKAYAMIVTERDHALLNTGYLEWSQLEDEIAVVPVNGKDVYFDPGQRYCEYGKLNWIHADVMGVRQTDNGPELTLTPGQSYPENETIRLAELQLAPNGSLTGTVRISMMGAEALRWRQEALRTDEDAMKKKFEDELQERVPDGVHVRLNHFLALNQSDSKLMAVVDVSGSLGTPTGKRVFLPGSFFEARTKPLFAQQKRESMVDLMYPYVAQDRVTIKLPPGMSIESTPTDTKLPLQQFALYQIVNQHNGDTFAQVRQITVGNIFYKVEEYPQLRDFFQKASAQDQQQVVLQRMAAAAMPASAPAGASQ